jgi:hypothetical protein
MGGGEVKPIEASVNPDKGVLRAGGGMAPAQPASGANRSTMLPSGSRTVA